MRVKEKSEHEHLIKDNQGLVYHLAARIFRNLPVRHEFDDLVGYGMVGLAEAAKSFEPTRGAKFSTFAFFRIRGAIFDGVSETGWMTRAQYRRYAKRLNAIQETAETPGDDERDKTTSDQSDYGTSDVVELTAEHIEQLADSDSTGPAKLAKDESESILCQCVDDLPRKENRLITLIYFEGHTLKDAAERIGVSKSWASRLHAQILQKLAMEINRRNNDPAPSD